MLELTIIFWALAFSVLVGVFAHYRRNRSGPGWFLLSCLITPLIAGLLVAILPARPLGSKPSKATAVWLGSLGGADRQTMKETNYAQLIPILILIAIAIIGGLMFR